MEYNAAVAEVMASKKIRRDSWADGTYVKFGMDPEATHDQGPPFVFSNTPPVVYIPTADDTQATDWEVVA